MLIDYVSCADHQRFKHVVVSSSSSPEIVARLNHLDIPHFQPRRSAKLDVLAVKSMSEWVDQHHVDIIHSYNIYANCWAGLVSFFSDVKVHIAGEHGTVWFSKPPLIWLERWVYGRSEKIIANSKASETMLRKRHDLSQGDIDVIYNGVPVPEKSFDSRVIRDALGINPDEVVIGSVGRLDTPKDYPTLLKAAKKLFDARGDSRLVLVGDGPLKNFLVCLAEDLGIGDKVLFTGWRDDARKIIGVFDIYVSTSVYESLGNTLIEAAFQEKPIIAPRIDGIPEIVVDGETGILLDPRKDVHKPLVKEASPLASQVIYRGKMQSPKSVSTEELAETLNYLIDRPDLQEAMGKNGVQRAFDMFSMERYAQELEGFYRQALERVGT